MPTEPSAFPSIRLSKSALASFTLACAAIAALGFWWNFYKNGSVGLYADAVNYQATGRSFVEVGAFVRRAVPYEDFGAGNEASPYYSYPNYLFSLLIGALGSIRGDYSLLNGLIVVYAAYVLASVICGLIMLSLAGNLPVAFLSVIALQFSPLMVFLPAPQTDAVLFLFFSFAILCSLWRRPFVAGFAMGIGYLFRAQGLVLLMFVPFVDRLPLRQRVRSGWFLLAGFLPGFLLNSMLKRMFSHGETASTVYGTMMSGMLDSLTPDILIRFPSHAYECILGLSFLCVPMLLMVTDPGRLKPASRRFVLISLVGVLLHGLLFTSFEVMPRRYVVYFVPLLLMVLYHDFLSEKRREISALLLTTAIAVFSIGEAVPYLRSISDVRGRTSSIFTALRRWQEIPWTAVTGNQVDTVVSNDPCLVAGYNPKTKVIDLPSPDVFKKGGRNNRVQMILVSERIRNNTFPTAELWRDLREIRDDVGNTFIRLPQPASKYYWIFMRSDLYEAAANGVATTE